MTQDEWLETPAADAITNFLAVMMGTLASAMGGAIGGILTKIGTSFFTFLIDEGKAERGDTSPDDKLTQKLRQQLDPDREDPRRNGLTIVAIWSAFESSFDDFAKALIMERPDALRGKDISRIKVPITQLFADGEEKAEVVLDGIKDAVGKGAGVSRCEAILKYVDLSGSVPKEIQEAVYHSQMIRHIWAHRVGIADAQFVQKAKQLGFGEGELVTVDTQQLVDYLSAIILYAMILMNRHRQVHGLEPVTGILDTNENTSGTMREAFHNLYVERGSA
ncbi:hypothetical protein [Mycolicibacterium sp.]|uniref:hypothetical protein n=1 Tax=Mycolicibacterium sp. TaxID=2320850 RepID=UPI0037C8DD12